MDQEIREKIRMLAGEALSYFEYRKRPGEAGYWTVEEDAPEWIEDLVFAAHDDGEILPEDFRYLFVVESLEAIAENPEEPKLEPGGYTIGLVQWLVAYPRHRINLVDKAVSEDGWNGLLAALQAGQLREKEEVLGIVKQFLEKEIFVQQFLENEKEANA